MQYPDDFKGEFDTPRHPNARTRPSRRLKIGSLCTGYGGLDMAVQQVLDAELVWVADNDRHVRQLLDERHPEAPNLGDISSIDWMNVPPADVVTAGFPCQDISFAGRGAGIAHCVGDA
jgi:DNA (cytosine-5)-methyltransferase 1